MRLLAISLLALAPCLHAQATGEVSRKVEGGGISAPGWTGKIDANEANKAPLSTAPNSPEGDTLHVTTGPAVTYWNPADKATGDYTVKATSTNRST